MREDTKKCIQEFQIKTFGNAKNIEKAETLVDANEVIRYIAPTNIITLSTSSLKKEKFPGIVILTNNRVIFDFQVLNNNHSEIFSVSEIRSIESSGNSLTGGHIIIHTISKDFDFLVTYKKDIIQNIQRTFDAIRATATQKPIQQTTTISEADELAKFKKLLDQGIIAEEEFDAKKKQILSL
nr:MAG TPA: Short C-terminal domain [Caudoviricetes sp.]